MTIEIANLIVSSFGLYFVIGAIFALLFVSFGAGKIDPAAKKMSLQARAIIFPGVMGLWPLMLIKLFVQREPPIR